MEPHHLPVPLLHSVKRTTWSSASRAVASWLSLRPSGLVLTSLPVRSFCVLPTLLLLAAQLHASPNENLRVVRFPDNNSADISENGKISSLQLNDRLGPWSLMAIIDDDRGKPTAAIFEDFSSQTGHLLFLNTKGIHLDLRKSLEPTSQDPAKLYLGHTLEEVIQSPTDLLADQILAKPGDPEYEEVASAFPPSARSPLTASSALTPPWTKSASPTEAAAPTSIPLLITRPSTRFAMKAACSMARSAAMESRCSPAPRDSRRPGDARWDSAQPQSIRRRATPMPQNNKTSPLNLPPTVTFFSASSAAVPCVLCVLEMLLPKCEVLRSQTPRSTIAIIPASCFLLSARSERPSSSYFHFGWQPPLQPPGPPNSTTPRIAPSQPLP